MTTARAAEAAFYINDIPPFTSLGGMPLIPERAEVIGKARELAPRLSARREETSRERRLPDATIEELRASGLLELRKPRDCGGLEIDNQTYAEVIAEIARGCGSTAWTVGIVNDIWFLGGTALPPEGRVEFFESGGSGTAPFYPRAGATARPAEGGVIVEGGEWPWASGSQIADWLLPRVDLLDADGQPLDVIVPLIPMDECEILDEWHTLSMRGSASNVVKLDHEVFVPTPRVGSMTRVLTGQHLGDVPDFMRQPWLTGVVFGLVPIEIGLARAALDAYLARAPGRPIATTTYVDKSAAVRSQLIAAEASQKIDAADLLLHRGCAMLDLFAAQAIDPTVAQRAKIRADLGYAGRLAQEAVQTLVRDAGASALDESSPLSRILADSYAVPCHAAFNVTTALENHGASLLGHTPPAMSMGEHYFI